MKFATAFLFAIPVLCDASDGDPNPLTAPSHYVTGFFGQSEIIFGSEDGRFGGGISYAYGHPEKRFQLGQIPAQLVYEGYVDHTQSDGGSGFPANATLAFGGLGYGRWRWPVDRIGNPLPVRHRGRGRGCIGFHSSPPNIPFLQRSAALRDVFRP